MKYEDMIKNLRRSLHSPANERALLRRENPEPQLGLTVREASRVLSLALQKPLEVIEKDLTKL